MPVSPPSQVAKPAIASADQELIDGYLQHLQASLGRRQRTAETYGLALERLCLFLAGKPLREASDVELEAFAGVWLHKRGVVARSRKPYVSALRGFYAWLKLPTADGLKHPRTGKPLPQALSLASAEKLMWAPDLATFVGIRDAAMLALLTGCGLRASGLVGMNDGDLQTEVIDGKPRLVASVVEKGERERRLPLPREAEMLLRVYLDHDELRAVDRDTVDRRGRPTRVLFVATRNPARPADQFFGEAVRLSRKAVWRMVQRYGDKAGVPEAERHPHAIRHLFGTELAEDDAPLLSRQALMGHADPKSTSIYEHMTIRRKAKLIDASNPLGKIKSPVSELLKRL